MHEVTAQDQDEAIDDYRRIANITKTFSNCCVSKIESRSKQMDRKVMCQE